MTTRDLYDEFSKLRSKFNGGNPHQPSKKAGLDPDGIQMHEMGDVEVLRSAEYVAPSHVSSGRVDYTARKSLTGPIL